MKHLGPRLAGLALMLTRSFADAQGSASAGALAFDWPQWRGPSRDAIWVDPDLAKPAPPGGFTVLWHAPVGFGFSSPIVSHGRVYVTESQLFKTNAQERVRCLDARNGHDLWDHSYGVDYAEWALDPKNSFGPRPTPLAANGRVFALGARGHLWCLDATNGAVLWRRSLPNKSKDSTFTPSPLLEGSLLILALDGAPDGPCVVALDATSGAEVWKAGDETMTFSSPLVIEAAGRRQLIVWTTKSVWALDPANGAVLWRERHPGGTTYPVAAPVLQRDLLLVNGVAFRLGSDQAGATLVWPDRAIPSRQLVSETSTPAVRGDHLYTCNLAGELVCAELGSGRIIWTTNAVTGTRNGGSAHITMTSGDDLILNEQGELIRARLAPAGYEERSRAPLLRPTTPFGAARMSWVPPAFAHGCIFARNDEELVCASLVAPSPGDLLIPPGAPGVVELWPGVPPDESTDLGPERVRMSPALDRRQVEVTESTRLITAVTKPTITIFRPAPDRDTGTAVLIFPGGGYWDVFWQLEGEEVAAWLQSLGVTGIVLKYRVPRRPDDTVGEAARRPLQDAQRAIRVIRSRQAQWSRPIERLGVMGFSAGGHLALAAATRFDWPTYPAVDAADRLSCRPDFAVPVYSGYFKAKDRDALSADWQIPAETPPVFLVHGTADLISPAEGSALAYLALRRAGVSAELHLYADTAHDFAVRTNDRPYSQWTRSCAEWMKAHGWIR